VSARADQGQYNTWPTPANFAALALADSCK
jgi:hypothetical protein